MKNLLLLAASVDKETYESVDKLMKGLPLPPGSFKVVVDHKMKSNVCGLSGGSATHWCEICTYNKNWGDDYSEEKAELRTFEQCRANYEAYQAAGAKKKDQKHFFNCVRPPMSFLPEEGLVVDTITPSALHLNIVVVSRIANAGMQDESKSVAAMMKHWLEVKLSLKKFAQRDEWEGGKCVTICSERALAKLRVLVADSTRARSDRLAGSRPPHGVLRYVDALAAFQAVRTACFGMELADNAADAVADFRSKYLALGLTVSRTVHVVLRHVVPFCVRNKCGLQAFVEQAHESLHRDFRVQHDRQRRANVRHPGYLPCLLQAVLAYNALHSGAVAAPLPPHDDDDDSPRPPPGPPPPDSDDDSGDEHKHDASQPDGLLPFPDQRPPSSRAASGGGSKSKSAPRHQAGTRC